MTARFFAFIVIVWYPLCSIGFSTIFDSYMPIGFVVTLWAPLIYKVYKEYRRGSFEGKKKRTITIDMEQLPALLSMNTAHWSSDEQIQFAKAVQGMRHIEWLRRATPGVDDLTRHRLATAFAFAGFSQLRRHLRLAPDEELMKDEAGRSSPNPQ